MVWSWLYLILISAVEILIHYSDLVFVCLLWCVLGVRAECGMLPEVVDTRCLLPSFSMICSETEFYWTWLADCLGWVANKPPGSFCLHLLMLRLEVSLHTNFLHRDQGPVLTQQALLTHVPSSHPGLVLLCTECVLSYIKSIPDNEGFLTHPCPWKIHSWPFVLYHWVTTRKHYS